jgi:serine/threonine protein kinase/WD40 repeat protein
MKSSSETQDSAGLGGIKAWKAYSLLWESGQSPDVHEFLREHLTLTDKEIVEILCVDQCQLWQRGERVFAESYLISYPRLLDDSELAVELIYGEFLARERLGEPVSLDEFTDRFPIYADRLRLQVELHRAMNATQDSELTGNNSVRGRVGAPGSNVKYRKSDSYFGLNQVSSTSTLTHRSGQISLGPTFPEIKGYQIQSEVGRGAMGIVYRAWQASLKRSVALKVLRSGAEDVEHVSRFRTEAEAAAQLRHPNIVQIYEVGEAEGRPYLAMEYVDGGSLARHLGGKPQPHLIAAQMVETLARAIHFAHERGIIHRDLKPGNILWVSGGVVSGEWHSQWTDAALPTTHHSPLTTHQVKISDFGLAKRLDDNSCQTQTGMILGTPSYMAPEQAAGTKELIGPAVDVYALGAMLYELLTGRPPFLAATVPTTLHQVQSQEPVSPRRLQPTLPRDLETICLKCLEKKPNKRYDSAFALAEDLARFQSNLPILARRIPSSERAWRWCRRNPVVATLTGSLVLLLAVLLGTSLINNARLEAQLERVERAEKEKTDKLWDSYLASAQASRWSGRPGRRFDGLEAVAQAAGIRSDLRLRNEAIALLTLPDVRFAKRLPNGMPAGSASVTFEPDFKHYARSDGEGNITIRQIEDDQEVQRLPGFGSHAWHMKFSPDGRFLLALYHNPGGERIWDWRQGHLTLESTPGESFEFIPDSTKIVVGKKDGSLSLYDLATRKYSHRIQVGSPRDWGYRGIIHPNGKLMAVALVTPPDVKVFDIAKGEVVYTFHPSQQGNLAWNCDGSQLAHLSSEQITVWNLGSWAPPFVLNTPYAHTTSGCFSPRDGLLASAGWDGMLRLWDPAAGRELLALHGAVVPQFSRDGSLLAGTREDQGIHIWEVTTSSQYRVLHSPLGSIRVLGADFNPDGTLLVQVSGAGATLWNVADGRTITTLPTGPCNAAVFSLDGSALFTRSAVGIQRWAIVTKSNGLVFGPPELVATLPWEAPYSTLERASNGMLAAGLREEGAVCLLDPRKPKEVIKLRGHTGSGYWLAASPDGRWIANISYWDFPDKVRVSDLRTGKVVWSYPQAKSVSFSPDSRWLATGGDSCRVWEIGTWDRERMVPAPPGLGAVIHAAFAPDGRSLAIAYETRVVRLVDFPSFEEMATLPAPDLPGASRLTFSADGAYLACSIEKVGTQLWDLRGIRAKLEELNLDWHPGSDPN